MNENLRPADECVQARVGHVTRELHRLASRSRAERRPEPESIPRARAGARYSPATELDERADERLEFFFALQVADPSTYGPAGGLAVAGRQSRCSGGITRTTLPWVHPPPARRRRRP